MLAFDVRDDNSAVLKVEYSLDGDRWQTVYPKDGIADSRVEQFELTLPEAQGAQGVVLRATDALNNVVERARQRCRARLRRSLIRAAPATCSGERPRSFPETWRLRPAGRPAWPAGGGTASTGRVSGMPRSTVWCDAFTVVRANSHTMLTATT